MIDTHTLIQHIAHKQFYESTRISCNDILDGSCRTEADSFCQTKGCLLYIVVILSIDITWLLKPV